MSGAYKQLQRHIAAFAVVYGIFLSLGELGPGNNLGLLASKTGPTAVRGHFYGVAAAVGKVGAFVGTWAFPPMITAFSRHGTDPSRGNTGPFWVGSGECLSRKMTRGTVEVLFPEMFFIRSGYPECDHYDDIYQTFDT